MNIDHVKKHYPNSKIENFKVQGMNINEFLEKYVGNKLDYLSIDLEGIDYDILMNLNLKKMMAKKDSIVNDLNKGIEFLLKKNKVSWVTGKATIKSPSEVEVVVEDAKNVLLKTSKILIASFPDAGTSM